MFLPNIIAAKYAGVSWDVRAYERSNNLFSRHFFCLNIHLFLVTLIFFHFFFPFLHFFLHFGLHFDFSFRVDFSFHFLLLLYIFKFFFFFFFCLTLIYFLFLLNTASTSILYVYSINWEIIDCDIKFIICFLDSTLANKC